MRNQGLGAWVHRRRVKSRGDVAVVFEGREITYDQLSVRIDRLANALADRGVVKGSRVAYLGNNHPAFLETFFACGVLGAVFVPLNTRLAPPEIEYAIEDAVVDTFVTDVRMRDLARAGAWQSRIRVRLLVGGDAYEGVESYDEAIAAASEEHRDEFVSLDDPAMILYTSGTTGRPKGAVLTHGNFTWNSFNALVDYDITSDSVTLLIAPLFHVASLGMGAVPAMLKGARVILRDKFEPGAVLRDIEELGVTALSGVPTTFQMLAEHPDWGTADLSSLRMLTCGGSSVPLRVLDAFEDRGLSFTSGYGMTETSPGATSLNPRSARTHHGSSGLAMFFTDVRVVDDAGKPVPAGTVGEIVIKGPNVIKEYWRRPEATAESRFGEWHRSGDLGFLDEDGYLYVSGRAKDMIISGGENIYPAEVEQIIMEIPDVDAVALIGKPDDKWGEVPLAVLVTKSGEPLPDGRVQAHLINRVAKYKVPRETVYIDEMPRNAAGKIRKVDLVRDLIEQPGGDSRPS
ncbi:fatty-acyl-CoA synthase [Pseudoclavibacter endophyticus]|uniref:Long-chain fatty acid--CoA ligase n=1 Tax=Pseudoclavibacter endophyticus TaxID=1778590 RepID=A0A6H9WIP7_9MICO|nr:long-chain fatty acid--CoA ligase [Pseudoclavibacter endophyticus]KAB1648387.1 long-chain fatty acid--CoA ligase [Pseudoclavibacter endophyticus]GGA72263.1 fatty-acyl-CoA synthase [Pseudoclavibacter endophyticus]